MLQNEIKFIYTLLFLSSNRTIYTHLKRLKTPFSYSQRIKYSSYHEDEKPAPCFVGNSKKYRPKMQIFLFLLANIKMNYPTASGRGIKLEQT